ncbi:MAG: hypothetical protein HY291_23325 [Planctomycetes bacterium]|nr:hypothetical protein [Planctomycetota bacterium]
MGLDFFVMPIRKYLGGTYDSPLKKILGDNIDKIKRVGREKPDFDRDDTTRDLENLYQALTSHAGIREFWQDEGETALSLQCGRSGLSSLQAYAAYLDYPLQPDADPESPPQKDAAFQLGRDPNQHSSLMRIMRGSQTTYPHLILHSRTEGFYVPVEFEIPVPWPEPGEWVSKDIIKKELMDQLEVAMEITKLMGTKDRLAKLKKLKKSLAKEPNEKMTARLNLNRIGSSQALLRELDRLNGKLSMSKDWGEFAEGESVEDEDEGLAQVKYGWAVLHYVARTSIRVKLPIVFDG